MTLRFRQTRVGRHRNCGVRRPRPVKRLARFAHTRFRAAFVIIIRFCRENRLSRRERPARSIPYYCRLPSSVHYYIVMWRTPRDSVAVVSVCGLQRFTFRNARRTIFARRCPSRFGRKTKPDDTVSGFMAAKPDKQTLSHAGCGTRSIVLIYGGNRPVDDVIESGESFFISTYAARWMESHCGPVPELTSRLSGDGTPGETLTGRLSTASPRKKFDSDFLLCFRPFV